MITYLHDLVSIPVNGALPLGITLKYSLGTTMPPEQATSTYSLDPDNDVYFQAGAGPPSKTCQTVNTVTAKNPGTQTIMDSATLVRGPGTRQRMIVISQSITDESGGPPLPDSCRLTVD
jgi:hypothetical protein